jgi:serine/threonine-protein kinase
VTVRAGEDSAVTLNLEKASGTNSASSSAVAAAGTGFKASGPAHIKMSLDGKELGPLPQEVKDATPGEHKIKFASTERYKIDERTITIGDKEVKDLGTIKLDVVKGKATLNLGTPGASVMLVSGAERKAVRQFPISIDIDTTRKWSIEATKAGFENFKQEIGFDDGEAEKTFSITLFEKGKTPKPDAPASTDGGDKPATTDKPPETGNGTLNINSIPPSNCILDGRPLGMTPKAGVSVPAGTHSVTFIHPEKGKQATSVTVKPGETKSVGVKFP